MYSTLSLQKKHTAILSMSANSNDTSLLAKKGGGYSKPTGKLVCKLAKKEKKTTLLLIIYTAYKSKRICPVKKDHRKKQREELDIILREESNFSMAYGRPSMHCHSSL